MEFYDLKSIAVSIVLVTVVTWAWSVLNEVWFRPKKLERYLRQQGLKGRPYRFMYGDIKENAMMLKEAKSKPLSISDDISPVVLPFLHKLVKDYGQNSFMWFGPVPRVTIMDPDQIKEIFTRINEFPKPKAINPISKLLATGLANYGGEKWTKHRRIINPAFHLDKLKLMLPEFYKVCSEMICKWEKLASKEGSCELDVWPYLVKLTGDVISRTAFGSNFEEGRRIFQLQTELADLTLQAIQSAYIPGSRFLPSESNKRMKELEKEIRALLMGIIKNREKAMKAGEATKNDLLGILMESNITEIRENGNNKNVGMTINDVIEECKLFYFAGQETTSVLLVWTLVLLSKHQNWQAGAREEVLRVFGHNKPNYDELNHLKIVSMILYEVLRLYPSVVMAPRAIDRETKLGNLSLPAGVEITLPIVLVHHDQELWGDDALEFKPERFLEGISKATKNQVSYFPFGWGPRICIGQNFALMEAKMALALILKNFTFELSPSYVHAPRKIFTVHPEHGAHLILKKL
ncbi:cytochrome P450 72A15-like [Pistacia vera]|uniref:cytochrome P450 72A15-like n=2 Tax=Pistacia vera TaxID=55513 RepID=UPI0012630572|nr:cytochrome P450 72A15-like [Pistacia vera]